MNPTQDVLEQRVGSEAVARDPDALEAAVAIMRALDDPERDVRGAAMEHVREASQTIVRWYGDDVIEGGPLSPRDGVLPVPQAPGLV